MEATSNSAHPAEPLVGAIDTTSVNTGACLQKVTNAGNDASQNEPSLAVSSENPLLQANSADKFSLSKPPTKRVRDHPAAENSVESSGEKVIESKTICYCSNFDININEWFNEYENIEIFKLNMKKSLGTISSYSNLI